MDISAVTNWLDKTLDVASFGEDVSNNGLQVARRGAEVSRVAFAVDASARAVNAAAATGAQLLVVHHGISWGGGIKRIDGGVYEVVKAAMDADLAIYASHLPLDAHPTLGNNAGLAKSLGLKRTKPAFSYHGYVIGLVGFRREKFGGRTRLRKIGVCSGGAGDFAEEAKRLGCDLFITGEASWGDVIAAENCGMKMECRGHYATETFGVRALAAEMKKRLGVEAIDLTEDLSHEV